MSGSATTTTTLRRRNDDRNIPIDINSRPSKRRHIDASPSSTLLLSKSTTDPSVVDPKSTSTDAKPAATPAATPAVPAVGGIEPEHWLPNLYAAPPPAAPGYLTRSPSYPIRPSHRSTVVNWLMQLRSALNIAPATLFVSVTIMDRFLSTHPDIRLHLLQLLACACVFISVKTYETEILTAGKLVSLSGGAFDYNSLIQMESIVLNRLHFNIIALTPLHALHALAAKHGLADTNVAEFAALVALKDHVCAEKKPADITLAAIHLAKTITAESTPDINVNIESESVQVLETARRMVVVWVRAVKGHDKGEFNFVVRSHPTISRQILATRTRKRLEKAYGLELELELQDEKEKEKLKQGLGKKKHITICAALDTPPAPPPDRPPPMHRHHRNRNTHNNNQLHHVDRPSCISNQPPTRT